MTIVVLRTYKIRARPELLGKVTHLLPAAQYNGNTIDSQLGRPIYYPLLSMGRNTHRLPDREAHLLSAAQHGGNTTDSKETQSLSVSL